MVMVLLAFLHFYSFAIVVFAISVLENFSSVTTKYSCDTVLKVNELVQVLETSTLAIARYSHKDLL